MNFSNQSVKAKDQRLFRQILELKQAGDKGESPSERDPPTWCGHLATPWPRKCGQSHVSVAVQLLLGERLLPLSSYALPRLIFTYKYCIFQRKETENQFKFFSLFLGFRFFVRQYRKVVSLFSNLQFSQISVRERERN